MMIYFTHTTVTLKDGAMHLFDKEKVAFLTYSYSLPKQHLLTFFCNWILNANDDFCTHTTETLKDGAQRFERTSTQVKRKMFSNNVKWTIALVVAVLLLILVIICMFALGIGWSILILVIICMSPWVWRVDIVTCGYLGYEVCVMGSGLWFETGRVEMGDHITHGGSVSARWGWIICVMRIHTLNN